jgi:hypothetical protein
LIYAIIRPGRKPFYFCSRNGVGSGGVDDDYDYDYDDANDDNNNNNNCCFTHNT